MSVFSQQLLKLIKEKNVNTEALYQYCGESPSVMKEYIWGKGRPPSAEVFGKIGEFLHLTPTEYQKFQEAYFISVTGRETYYKRKSVENFIIDFPNPLPRLNGLKQKKLGELPADSFAQKTFCTALGSQIELKHCLYRIFLKEAQKENGRIGLLLQPDQGFLFQLLSSLQPEHSLEIEHLFCMSSSGQMNENNELYSLEYLKTMLPLYVADLNYHPCYFYGDIHSHCFNFTGLSCLILTSEYALTCTADYRRGILYGDQETVSMFWKLFQSYREQCQELFQAVKFLPDYGQALESVLQKEKKCYTLQPESCLTPFITDEILRNVLNPGLPNEEILIRMIHELFADTRELIEAHNTYIYFTRQGLENFAETGKLKEIPDDFYQPFSVEDRIRLLRAMLPYCESWHYRIVSRNYPVMARGGVPENFHLCINETFGYLLFTNIYHVNVELRIREPGLLSVLEDYMENLDDHYFLSSQECVKVVEGVIERLVRR